MAESLDIRFTQFLLESKALKFGEFTLRQEDRHARRVLR